MMKKTYQELMIELYSACCQNFSDIEEYELIQKHLMLLKTSSDICADLEQDFSYVLSMMILSLEINPGLSNIDRKSLVYGMSVAGRDLEAVDLSQKEVYERSIKEFRCTDSHITRYNIEQASLGYQELVFRQIHPKFLEKK